MSVEYPKHVVDTHTHLFNARYLPLESILHKAIRQDFGDKDKVIKATADLLNILTGSSYADRQKARPAVLRNNRGDGTDEAAENIWIAVESELTVRAAGYGMTALAARPEDVYEDISRSISTDPLYELLVEIERLYAKEISTDTFLEQDPLASIRSLEAPAGLVMPNAFHLLAAQFQGIWNVFKRAVKWLLKKIAKLADPATWDYFGNLLEFFLGILRSEAEMLRRLEYSYASEQPVTLYVHHMMDMELAYAPPRPPFYDYVGDQLRRMRMLACDAADRLVGFAALDPRRDVSLLGSILEEGFIGVKLYPPMGYKASGNADSAVEEWLDQFFLRCIAEDIPVFTHCTPVGFEAAKGLGLLSHPKYWKERLERDGHGALRLCFGHAGGGRFPSDNGPLISAGWDAQTEAEWKHDDNYARVVTELCVTYPNVYCELSYLHDALRSRRAAANIQNNLLRVLNAPHGSQFARKIMFGTDWHMPRIIDDTDRYLRFFADLFEGEDLRKHRESFFWQNALRYLNFPGFFARMANSNIPQHVREYAMTLRKTVVTMESDVPTVVN